VLDAKAGWGNAPVMCICSGGNVDPVLYADILNNPGAQ